MMKFNVLCITAVGLLTLSQALANSSNYIYFHANAGYAYHPWASLIGPPDPDSSTYNWDNGNDGLTYGLDIGYQFSQYFGVETGYYGLPNATLTQIGITSAQFKTNVYYVALRGLLPITQSLSATGKVGIGAQVMNGNRATFNEDGWQENNSTNAMLGAGLDYAISNNVDVNLQYLFFNGKTSNVDYTIGNTQILPDAQLLTLGIGYSFSV